MIRSSFQHYKLPNIDLDNDYKNIQEQDSTNQTKQNIQDSNSFYPYDSSYPHLASNDKNAGVEELGEGKKEEKKPKYLLAHSPLADIIGKIESQNKYTMCNYKKVNSKNKIYYAPIDLKELTTWTLKEVMEKQIKKEIFATGRFQTTPNTLLDAKEKLNLNENDLYNEEMQDRIFEEYLINKKRPKVMDYLRGDGNVDVAAYELAKEFASVGVEKGKAIVDYPKNIKRISNGKQSYYEDIGGNKMLIPYDEIKQALEQTKQILCK